MTEGKALHRPRIREVRRLHPPAKGRPWLKLLTISGSLNKTYGHMTKGYIGHFNRVCTGLPLSWEHSVFIGWVTEVAAAPIDLLLEARWDPLVYTQLRLGKINLPW